MIAQMNRKFLTLLALVACLPAWGQDNPAAGSTRDSSGFLPLTATPPAMYPVVTNRPVAAVPDASVAPTSATPAATAVTPAPDASAPPAGAPDDTNFVTSGLVAQASIYKLDDKHKLAPGDHISFEIVEDRTNAMPMLVTESSELDVPYIGRLSVADKTCKELAAEIKTMLEKDYYYKATVIIGLDELGTLAGKVYVMGPVQHPGPVQIPANENFTVTKAILDAGGFSDFANKTKVQLIRKSALGTQTFTVNVAEVIKGNIEKDLVVEDGDMIVVPQRLVNIGQ
jgi:protein involved in polysaccharide export with SLBB domain